MTEAIFNIATGTLIGAAVLMLLFLFVSAVWAWVDQQINPQDEEDEQC